VSGFQGGRLIDLLLIILIACLGAVFGCGTGIVVGLHINNLSLLLLSISGIFCSLLAPLETIVGIDNFTALLLAIFLVAAAIAHTFVNIIIFYSYIYTKQTYP
jgi:TctA family transporter